MKDTRLSIFASPGAASQTGSAPPANRSRRHHSLRGLIMVWRERNRFRTDLERSLQGDPHLIDDIGLTRRQVEEELARPFWQVL